MRCNYNNVKTESSPGSLESYHQNSFEMFKKVSLFIMRLTCVLVLPVLNVSQLD